MTLGTEYSLDNRTPTSLNLHTRGAGYGSTSKRASDTVNPTAASVGGTSG